MKKLIFMLLCLMLCTMAIAQTEIGFKAGIGASKMAMVGGPENYNNSLFTQQRVAYQLGGYGSRMLSDKLLARAEILFNSKGSELQNLYYLSIPLLLQYKILNKLSIEGGPELGYLLFAMKEALSYKTFDVGMNLGANFIVCPKITLGVRYNIGIANMLEGVQVANDQGVLIDMVSYQNRALQLSMSYSLFDY